MRVKSAVVNGALGAIGLALVEALVKKDIKTYAIVYPGDDRISKLPGNAITIQCDMREIHRLKELITESVDAFFHLAWMGTIGPGRDDMLMQTDNIRCAIEACNAAKDLNCQVYVGVGSQAEHGRIEGLVKSDSPCFPVNGYGMAKLCAGEMTRTVCAKLGIRHVWARVLSVYGPNDSPMSVTSMILDKLFAGEKPMLTLGEQEWDYLYADDAAKGLICMAENGRDGLIYPLGSGKTRSLREYFEIIRDAVDPELPLGIGEISYPPNQVMHLEADISGLKKDTGFEPEVSFEEGARRVVEQYKKRMSGK